MTTAIELRKQYDALKDEIASLVTKQHDLIVGMRATCDHSDIGEAPALEAVAYEAYHPRVRVCLVCGIREEAYCGFSLLRINHPRVFSRGELIQKVIR